MDFVRYNIEFPERKHSARCRKTRDVLTNRDRQTGKRKPYHKNVKNAEMGHKRGATGNKMNA